MVNNANALYARPSRRHPPRRLETCWRWAFVIVALLSGGAARAATLDAIRYSTLPGERVRVELKMSEPVAEPLSFAIDNPARVALDFPGVTVNLPRRSEEIGVGMARSVTAVESGGRTRVVLNLVKLVPYELSQEGAVVFVTLASAQAAADAAFESQPSSSATALVGETPDGRARINNVDFRRGEDGEGRVIVTLSDPSTVVDTYEEGGRIIVEFFDTALPPQLERRLDVVDFATPVTTVDTAVDGKNVRMTVEASGTFDQLAYQSDDLFTLEVRPLTAAEQEELKRDKFQYSGERLSLNFQNVQVRAVLQLLADFTGLNLVASDTVGGSLTLRLKNVPWDQAMDIILRTKGLAMRQTGNVILVAPTEEIAAREKLELEAQKQLEELAPLRSEFIQVNYAKAATLAGLLKTEGNSLMTARGNVTVDERTNTLLVRDTAEALDGIRRLVTRLDIPVRQVLIESRIVFADSSFNRDLGVKWGISYSQDIGASSGTPGTAGNPNAFLGGKQPGDTNFGDNVSFNTNSLENYIVDLPIGNPAGALGFAIVAIPDWLLQLEITALQTEGRGEVLSNPRVVTSDQKEAVIEQGTEIPFQEATSSGATSTSFKKAVLSLKVTPQITPDDRILMDLSVHKDEPGPVTGGVPAVNTRNVTTQVLVNNGETVVLGGIFESTLREDAEKVPFFGDLPWLGWAFRRTFETDERRELLIFVTPKILKEFLSAG